MKREPLVDGMMAQVRGERLGDGLTAYKGCPEQGKQILASYLPQREVGYSFENGKAAQVFAEWWNGVSTADAVASRYEVTIGAPLGSEMARRFFLAASAFNAAAERAAEIAER